MSKLLPDDRPMTLPAWSPEMDTQMANRGVPQSHSGYSAPLTSLLPPLLRSCLGEDEAQKLIDSWDREPIHFPVSGLQDSLATVLLGEMSKLPGFLKLLESCPLYAKELRAEDSHLHIKPLSGTIDQKNSLRAEFLGLQGPKSMFHVFDTLAEWVGGGWKDYWFFTPPHSNSVPVHYDSQNNLILQLHGRKHWRLFPRVDQEVVHGFPRQPVLPSEAENEKAKVIVMEPGDILLLPRGVPHVAHTEDESSLHLDLNLIQPTRFQLDAMMRWYQLQESWAAGGWGIPQALDQAVEAMKKPVDRLEMDREELMFLWQAAIEAGFERQLPPPPTGLGGRLAMGLFSKIKLEKSLFHTHKSKRHFWISHRGKLLSFPLEFLEGWEALRSQGWNDIEFRNARKSFPDCVDKLIRGKCITVQ